MKFLFPLFCSTFLLQTMLSNTTPTYSNSWAPAYALWQYPSYRSKVLNNYQEVFYRNTRARNNARTLSIDLSQLMPRSTEVPFRARNKPPLNLLGIDISVLSRNPDPKIPIVPSSYQVSNSRKIIPGDSFDPRYDRLPVIETENRVQNKVYRRPLNSLMYPFQHLPLNVVTTYHSIMTNKKENANIRVDSDYDENENEKRYTADFILHLLYQLSSSQREGY